MRNGRTKLGGALCVAAMLALSPAALAQLPRLPSPTLPGVSLPNIGDSVAGTANGVARDLDVRRLTSLRDVRIRELLRTQRATVERDPNGAPVMRAEIVAFSPTDGAITSARSAGFVVIRDSVLDGFDARIVVLRAPPGLSTRRALARLRTLDPSGAYDFNHIYLDSGDVEAEGAAPAHVEPATDRAAAATTRIGLVDGGVDATHPVFKDALIHQHGCADKAIPSAHGTAVASLLIGRSERFRGAAPDAQLYAADVYCGLADGGAVDAVVEAISWIAHERVPVINVSLVGPRNVALEGAVRAVIARGFIVVAAVGNDGPAAAPLYPAAYPGVVGVTGVDARQKALVEACRGPQVTFAAPGADMAAALLAPSFAAVRGTSFAAPIVAGLLAARMREPDARAARQAVAELVAQAVDLGAKGVDETYGNGLVGGAVRTEPVVALVGPPTPTTVAGSARR
jgi:subtilisin family serine protease